MGNIGSVDLEELKRAREELNRERGIENDPDMYKYYNPNRNKEESNNPEQTEEESLPAESPSENIEQNNYDNITELNQEEPAENVEISEDYNESYEDEQIDEFSEKSENGLDLSQFEIDSNSSLNDLETENTSEFDEEDDDIDELDDEENEDFDINEFFNKIIGEGSAPSEEDENDESIESDEISDSDESTESSDFENKVSGVDTSDEDYDTQDETSENLTENEISYEENIESSNEENVDSQAENSYDSESDAVEKISNDEKFEEESNEINFDVYDNFAEFEVKGYQNNLPHEEVSNQSTESENAEENLSEESSSDESSVGKNSDEKSENQDDEDEVLNFFEDSDDELDEENSSDTSENGSEESVKEIQETESLSDNSNDVSIESIEDVEKEIVESNEETESLVDSRNDLEIDNSNEIENMLSDEPDESEELVAEADEEIVNEESSEDFEVKNEINVDNSFESTISIEPEETKNIISDEYETSKEDEKQLNEVILSNEDKQIDNIEENIEVSSEKSQDEEYFNDEQNENDFENQIFSNEVEPAQSSKIEAENDVTPYDKIKDFKFIDVLESDEFKNSEKLSYFFGKDEENRLMFMNIRDMFNTAIFGLDERTVFSQISSMLLSLSLKNTVDDVNFVICDSKLESDFDIFNKSSFMFFNRVAKTNREILDTLTELENELEQRYNTLVEVDAKNIEHYNKFARDAEISPMPYIVIVFNNYTRSAGLALGEQINLSLANILKLGRLVGIYAVVSAYETIEKSSVNLNLSGRLAFKANSEDNSNFQVGTIDATRLVDENDFVYTSVSGDETFHLKTAKLSPSEANVIIENLEK